MGESTNFEGAFTFDRPLTPAEKQKINDTLEQDFGQDQYLYGLMMTRWCDWRASDTDLTWSGSEKSYSMYEWLDHWVTHLFEPMGLVLNGEVRATPQYGSPYLMRVEDNHVTVFQARVEFVPLEDD